MKVFNFNNYDYVCTKNKKDAIKYYMGKYKLPILGDIIEVPLDKTIYYSSKRKTVQKMLEKSNMYLKFKTRFYEIKVGTEEKLNFVVKLSFREIIIINDIRESYMIADPYASGEIWDYE